MGSQTHVTLVTSALPSATKNVNYSYQLTASGGLGRLTWSWKPAPGSELPPGFLLSSSGVLSGKSETQATVSFYITVQDDFGDSATKLFTFEISS